MNNSSAFSTATATTVDAADYYYDAEYEFQDEAAALPVDFQLYGGYGQDFRRDSPEPQLVEPEDELQLAVDNFHTLKTLVPNAENRFLWEIAQDCVKHEDGAKQRAEDLINTSDYPVECESTHDGNLFDEPDANFSIAQRYSVLRGIFPKAAASWVWNTAKDHAQSSEDVFNTFVQHMHVSGDYPKCNYEELPAPVKIEAKKMEWTRLAQEICHNIDPQHIEQQLNTDTAMGYNEQGVSEIILSLMNNAQNSPSRSEEYYRRITQEAILQYSNDFDVEKFLLRFPNPVLYFEKPANPGGPKYRADVFKYLRSVAPQHNIEYIQNMQKQEKYLIKCHRRLFGSQVPIETVHYQLKDACARFINELTYVRFHERIVQSAAIYASLLDTGRTDIHASLDGFDFDTCELCEEEVPWRKVLQCTEAHMFCEECVRRWVDDRLENGYVVVGCMQDCQGTISDDALKRILQEGALERLIKRRQDQEVGLAQLDGIVHCMWCDFSYIPRVEDMDLVCLSPECGERWCKKCSQLAHFPNPCSDTPEEVKKRVFIEERMTRAAVKFCPRCTTAIQKIDGCDHVLCKCGASVCYNCGELTGHHHCSQPRPTMNVRAAGELAKAEAEQRFPNVKLNFDPTKIL